MAPASEAVDRLLEDDEAAVCGPVMTEIRRGLRTAADRRRVLPLFAGCHVLEQPPALWDEAGDLGFHLARKGVTVRTLDLLIATHALAHDVALLTSDANFAPMVRAGVPLRLTPVR